MAASYFSPNWYRVKDLSPRLRSHVAAHRHVVRGVVWHVLQDAQTGSFFRVTPAAYRFLSGLDGRRTVAELWEAAGRRIGDDHLSQEEVIMFLAQLHRSDMLIGEDLPDLGELLERSRSKSRRAVLNRVRNPLALRIPVFDPDAFLERWIGLVRPLFTPAGFLAWLALVLWGSALAATQWDALTQNVFDRVVSLDTLAFVLILYPIIKAFHELGHGFAVKAWGGQVHELGIMILVFMPVPYVDASAASAFRQRRRRAVVGGVGIMVELALAAIAMIVWTNAEPGLVRAAAFNVMLIGGISTLLFNGNPLLRFDGYYVLCDALDIPNLGTRSNRYIQYLVQRYAFGKRDAEDPSSVPGERGWFVAYGVLAFVYRMFIMIVISLFVASQFFFVGVLLALLAVFVTIVMPMYKGWRFVFGSNRLGDRQRPAQWVTLTALAALAGGLFVVPAPDATVSEGVVWPSTAARVVASNGGFVTEVKSTPDTWVEEGEALITLGDPELDAQIATLEVEEREFLARFNSSNVLQPAQARIASEQLQRTRAALAFWRERRQLQSITARAAGEFVLLGDRNIEGHLVSEGTLLGYVLSDAPRILHVVVPQARINDIRRDTTAVAVRFASAPGQELSGEIVHITPSAIDAVPSAVLATGGGGSVLLDPEAPDGVRKPLQKHYEVEVRVHEEAGVWRAEERAMVRFRHSPAPLGVQLWRSVRDVFLRQFNV